MERWVEQISKNFEEEVGFDVSHIRICVFNVPNFISRFKPEAYVPQAIALGPYHHFATHLYQMERYKVAVVKAFVERYNHVQPFEVLVINELKKNEMELMIRACYHKYLDLDGDALAWIFAIDGLFLLHVFKHYGQMELFIPKKLMRYELLYRDMMVLENQIPLVILNKIQKIIQADFELLPMMIEYCKEHSPLKLTPNLNSCIETTNYLHFLDLMYRLIVNNKSPEDESNIQVWRDELIVDEKNESKEADNITEELEKIEKIVPKIKFKGFGKIFGAIGNIPWGEIYSDLLQALNIGKKFKKEDANDHPHAIEIDIPSVSSLRKYGHINFNPSTGGIRDTKFVVPEATLYLPVITLKVYSEAVLRNLVAYEIATSSSTMVLAQYVDLMSGIIDTEEDVMLLKYNGIIKGNMRNKEIVDLFNGINKSTDARDNKTVRELNKYYNKRLAVKVMKFMKKGLHGSQKVLMVVLTLLGCLFLIVYSFCEVYGCPKLFK